MKKSNIKKILSLLLAICVFGSCCIPVFANTTSDGDISLQGTAVFGQDNITEITYRETTDGKESVLYDCDSSDDSVNSLSSLQMPAEVTGITVKFDVDLNLSLSNLYFYIMAAEDYEEIQDESAYMKNIDIPYSVLTYEKNVDDKTILECGGFYLEYGKEYVIVSNNFRDASSHDFGGGTQTHSEIFRFQTKTSEIIAAGYDEQHAIKISDAEDLLDIRQDPNGGSKCYILTDDIDMSTIPGYKYPDNISFTGILDGNGHAIKNFTYKIEPGATENAALFKEIRHDVRNRCSIKNLTFTDVRIGSEDDPAHSSSIIAINGFGSFTFSNVHIGTESAEENYIYTNGTKNYFGSFVGYLENPWQVTLKDCTVDNTAVKGNGVNERFTGYGAFIGNITNGNQIAYTPEVELEKCTVNGLKVVMNGSQGIAGAFLNSNTTTVNLKMIACTAENISIESNVTGGYMVGGLCGAMSAGGDISDVTLENVDIALNKCPTMNMYVGGFTGKSSGATYDDVRLNKITIDGTEELELTGTGFWHNMVGGMVGYSFKPNNNTDSRNKFKNIVISNSEIKNIKTTGTQYVAGFVAGCEDFEEIKNIYVDCAFTACSAGQEGNFGEVMSDYQSSSNANSILTISNTYYNAENDNESNESLGELFEVSDCNISSSPDSSVEPTVPVTFGIEVVTDESVNADEDTESGEASETEKTDVELMTNRDSATVSVQAYEAVSDENGNITKGDKIEGFFDAFPDAVSVENWTIVPYSEETPDAVSSDKGFTTGNTKVSPAGDSAVQAVLSSSAGIGTEEEPAQIVVSVDVNGETRTVTVPYRYVYVSSGGGGGSSSGNKTETVTEDDGTIVTTVTGTDGTVTVTTEKTDGSKEVVVTEKDGTVTTTNTDTEGNKTVLTENPDGTSEMTVENADGSSSVTEVTADGQKNTNAELTEDSIKSAEQKQEAAVLPMDAVSAVSDSTAAQVISVSMPEGVSAKVEIPVENVTAGTVALIVNSDGTEDVIKTSVPSENGIEVMLKDGDTIKIIDNSKSFDDVNSSYWGADAVAFVTSRELFNGTGSTTFSPEGTMTRAMIVTVLARLEGVDTDGGTNWYDQGVQWAMANGISDGTNLQGSVSREQLATMLYRYAGSPTVSCSVEGFSDAGSISSWAENAMTWAVDSGLISGMGDGTVNSQGQAERAQVATILMRFIENIA